MADQNEIDRVLEATDIVSLVSEYVKLEKYGKNYKGLCPFHNEATPSFVVSTDKKIAHCFGCGGGGNAITFLQKIENINFEQALSKLAQKSGIKLKYTNAPKVNPTYQKLYEIMENSKDFYLNNLQKTKSGLKALDYLYKRGLDEETIKEFNIGLAPNSYDSLFQVLKELKYLELDMVDVGLVSRNDKNQYYDLFRDRIMFPIIDDSNHVIGFSGRIFDNPDKNQAKYVNTKETIIFKKGQNLFNLNLAKSEILKKKRIVLHEGQMDVIASYRSGIKEAVCSLGTALTDEQVKLISKYTKNIIICYDADKAGINASIKAIKLLRKYNFSIHLVKLPQGMDPDEYVLKNSKEAYLEYFENNIVDSTSYIFNVETTNLDINDSVSVEEAKKIIFEELSLCSNSIKETYLKNLANLLNVSFDSINLDFNTFLNKNTNVNYNNNYNNNYSNYNQSNSYNQNSYEGNIIDNSFKEDYQVPYDNYEPVSFAKPLKPEFELKNLEHEFKLITVAKRSRKTALELDDRLDEYINYFNYDSKLIWSCLIDKYYAKYETFNEKEFCKMLGPSLEYYKKGITQLRKYSTATSALSSEEIENCFNKLKLIQINEKNKELNKKLASIDDENKQAEIIMNKFKNIKQKEALKNGRK